MARTFVAANIGLIGKAAAIASAYPLTFSCFLKLTSIPALNYATIFSIGNGSDLSLGPMLIVNSGGNIDAAMNNTGDTISTVALSVGVWAHIAAIWRTAASRSVYVNGANRVNGVVNAGAFSGLSFTSIGWGYMGGTYLMLDGAVAIPGVWTLQLTDADILALSKGISPRRYHPQGLISAMKLTNGNGTLEVDDVNNDLTNPWQTQTGNNVGPGNGTSYSPNPPIYGP